jgi:protein-disulfide isomerase-like protein with CxxC motif
MDVAFFFDPMCAWAWLASRWLLEVASYRGLRLSWCSYSNLLACRTRGLPAQLLVELVASHRALRVIEAVRHQRPTAVRGLYESIVRHGDADRAARRVPFADLRHAVADAGLDPAYAAAAFQERWDEAIVASMETAHAVFGRRADVPAVILSLAEPIGFNCPKISPMPTGRAALALWDARMARAGVQPAGAGQD